MRGSSALVDAVAQLRRWPHLGPWNFLLSDGEVLYARRLGGALLVLERSAPGEAARAPDERAPVAAAFHRRNPAAIVASESMTDEPFRGVPDGTLLAVRAGASPRVEVLHAA